jgi:hypothetical protein
MPHSAEMMKKTGSRFSSGIHTSRNTITPTCRMAPIPAGRQWVDECRSDIPGCIYTNTTPQNQPGKNHSCDECCYVGPKYRVRKRVLEKHVELGRVPYLCLFCSARFDMKTRASLHLSEHREETPEGLRGVHNHNPSKPG